MSKKAPSASQLLVIAGFALSCFGILLFLWVTFGGPTPFRAQPYELKVPFTEATQLAEQSDVRISGVNVGKVRSIDLAPNGKDALATVDIEPKYAPIPTQTRAILRTKTLLGETYIELTPGPKDGPRLADGGTLAKAQVAESVQLDEIFRAFNPQTRAAFQSWMQESAIAINGQGESLSAAIGEFEPAFSSLDRLFRTLDSQQQAVTQIFRNGAETFQALRGREGQLASLIQSSDEVFSTTAARDQSIEEIFRAFPTFQDESKLTLDRLSTFAKNTDPLMRQLVPAAKELSPTLIAFANLAPEAKGFFEGLSVVIERAPAGFPALRKLFRDEFPPLLRALDPFIRNLNPFLTGLGLYQAEVTSFFANIASASNGQLTTVLPNGEKSRFLRLMGPMMTDILATFDNRLTSNRNSAYSPPRWAAGLASGLPGFDTRQCSAGITASLDPTSGSSAALMERTKFGKVEEAEDLFARIKKFVFVDQESTATLPAPACTQQAPFSPIYGTGPATQYQQTFEQPAK